MPQPTTNEAATVKQPYIQLSNEQLEGRCGAMMRAAIVMSQRLKMRNYSVAVTRSIYPANQFTITMSCDAEWMCDCHMALQNDTRLLDSDEDASQFIWDTLIMLEKHIQPNIH